MKNNVQLITYIDRLTGSDTKTLNNILNDQLADLFSGIHLLPFYFPIDGSDAGFDPIDHTQVDSRLGNWNDIKALGEGHELMADLIVNHMSAKSKEFKSVLQHGQKSPYWDLFLTKYTALGLAVALLTLRYLIMKVPIFGQRLLIIK